MENLEICLDKNKKKPFKQQEKHKSFRQKLINIKKKQQKQYLIYKIKKNSLKSFKSN